MKSMPFLRLLSLLFFSLTLVVNPFSAFAVEPPRPGATAPDFSLKTLDARSVKLSAETAGQPVVLVVLRGWPGYQCPLCTRQVHEFVARANEFAGKARVIMVYPGPAKELQAHAKEFLVDSQWPNAFLFVTDPDFVFTQSYGLRWDAPSETAYPSTFVIDRKGVVQFVQVSKSHGDRVSANDALAAVAKLN
jgi:peroxiredoxin